MPEASSIRNFVIEWACRCPAVQNSFTKYGMPSCVSTTVFCPNSQNDLMSEMKVSDVLSKLNSVED